MLKLDITTSATLALLLAYFATVLLCNRELIPPMTGFLSIVVLALPTIVLFVYTIINIVRGSVDYSQYGVMLFVQFIPILCLGYFVYLGFTLPVIHDVSTDIDNPPVFQHVPDSKTERYQFSVKDKVAYLEHYGDIQSYHSKNSPKVLFEKALDVSRKMGFKIIYQDEKQRHIEAVAKTALLRFRDDIAIRITLEHAGAKLDIRSISRLGQSDFGANAKRIRLFLKQLSSL